MNKGFDVITNIIEKAIDEPKSQQEAATEPHMAPEEALKEISVLNYKLVRESCKAAGGESEEMNLEQVKSKKDYKILSPIYYKDDCVEYLGFINIKFSIIYFPLSNQS